MREAAGVDRRKSPRRTGAEPLGPGLFEWAGLETAPLEPGESAMDPPDWPPVVVPLSPANRARPFGRRPKGVPEGVPEAPHPPSTPEIFDLFPEPIDLTAPRPTRLRRLQPLEAVGPEIEAEFSDVPGPEDLAAAEQAAEVLREVIDRQAPIRPAAVRPAQALLLSLANTLLLERDRLEARLSDQSAPLVLTPLRRRRGERDPMCLQTANDRG